MLWVDKSYEERALGLSEMTLSGVKKEEKKRFCRFLCQCFSQQNFWDFWDKIFLNFVSFSDENGLWRPVTFYWTFLTQKWNEIKIIFSRKFWKTVGTPFECCDPGLTLQKQPKSKLFVPYLLWNFIMCLDLSVQIEQTTAQLQICISFCQKYWISININQT